MTTLTDYKDLPEAFRAHLTVLEDFIGDCDGRSTVIWSSDGESCVDDGTLDAEDAVKAFNGVVEAIRAENERLRAALRSAPNPVRMVGNNLPAYVDWYFTERLSALATWSRADSITSSSI